MYAERTTAPTDPHEGTSAEVATHVARSRTRGSEVAALACPPVADLIDRFGQAAGPWEVAAIASELGGAGDHRAVRPLLARLGERGVQTDPELAEALCTALVALDVMCECGECSFAIRPRHLLAADVVDDITELGPAVPLRYLIACQAHR